MCEPEIDKDTRISSKNTEFLSYKTTTMSGGLVHSLVSSSFLGEFSVNHVQVLDLGGFGKKKR